MLTRLILAFAIFSSTVFAQSLRIVSTAPSITELLYALGLGDRIVGVDRFSHYPAEAAKKPQIGDYAAPNLEAIAQLKPSLVMRIAVRMMDASMILEAVRVCPA